MAQTMIGAEDRIDPRPQTTPLRRRLPRAARRRLPRGIASDDHSGRLTEEQGDATVGGSA